MIEAIIYGRGGQGVVIASEILAAAMFEEGKHVQAFPSFGAERRGAQVAAFMRAGDEEILHRCQVYNPDHVIILDSSVFQTADIGKIMKSGGWMIINDRGTPDLSGQSGEFHAAVIDATAIAVKYRLGTKVSSIVNTAILGAFAKMTGEVRLESLLQCISQFVSVKSEENAAATKEAYELVREVS